MPMDFESGRIAVLKLLADTGKAKNSELIRALGGNRELYEEVREDLIFEDIAADKNGVGLIYLGVTAIEKEELEPETQVSAPAADTNVRLRIFLSYGHDEHAGMAERIKTDLEKYGHEVWFDVDQLRAGMDWETYIESGFDWVCKARERGRVILLMTPYSVRRPDGFCLNELARARDRHMNTVPIMVVQVEPPLSICRIQWLDFRDCVPLKCCEGQYQFKFKKLVDALENNTLDTEGGQSRLRQVLSPLSYDTDIKHHLPRFTGRKWLFELFDQWLSSDPAYNVFWITGAPGVGKTAISSWLCSNRREVAAFHICKSGHSQKSDPRHTVRSLAYQLATQLPEYFRRLNQLTDLDELCEKENAHALFERLIIEPTGHGFPAPDRTIVILIDGLDEATSNGGNELAEFLSEQVTNLPTWMRLVITSRCDQEVMQPFQALDPIVIEASSDENQRDIIEYLYNEIPAFAADNALLDRAIKQIAKQSEGIFLYVDWVRQELTNNRLSLDRLEEFPQGLGGVYAQFFRQKFSSVSYYEAEYCPVLMLIATAQEPISIQVLAATLDRTEHQVRKTLVAIGSLFLVTNAKVRPFHRSVVDWLLSVKKSGVYSVDATKGHELLSAQGWREFQASALTMTNYFLIHLPYHLNMAKEHEKVFCCATSAKFIQRSHSVGRLYEIASLWKGIDRADLRAACRASYENCEKQSGEEAQAMCLGQLFQHAGDYEEAITYFNDMLALSRLISDNNSIGRAYFNLGWCLRHIDRFDEAIVKIRTAITYFEESNNKAGTARSWSIIGICYWQKQEDVNAMDSLKKALILFDSTSALRDQAEAHNHLGIVYRSLGMFEEALEQLNKAKQVFLTLNDQKGLGKCYNSIGTAYWWSGDINLAIESYRNANTINEQLDQPYIMGLTSNNLGYIYLEQCEFQNAEEQFSRARMIHQKLGIESYEMMDVSGLARVAHAQNAHSAARRLSQEAIAGLQKYSTVEDLRRAYYNHYIIMSEGNDVDREVANQALIRAKELVMQRLEKIPDDAIRNRLPDQIPVMREIIEA